MNSRTYGFTAYELQYIKPHTEKPMSKSVFNRFLVAISAVVGVLMFVQYVLVPMIPIVHADTPMLSDSQQERQYCKLWMQGTEVSGGTDSAISKHCARFN